MDGDEIAALGPADPIAAQAPFLSVNQLRLHETGHAQFDALTIEYNNFLVARIGAPGLVVEILRALQSTGPPWDEIVLGGISSELIAAANRPACMSRSTAARRISASICPPQPCRSPWEDTLSANQRAQLRQSRAFRRTHRPPRLKPARDRARPWIFSTKWRLCTPPIGGTRNKPGAFATAIFTAFHRELIAGQAGPGAGGFAGTRRRKPGSGLFVQFSIWRPGVQLSERLFLWRRQPPSAGTDRPCPGDRAGQQARACRSTTSWRETHPTRPGWARPMGTMVWCRAQRDRPLLIAERAARKLYQGLRAPCRRAGPGGPSRLMPVSRQLVLRPAVLECYTARQQSS